MVINEIVISIKLTFDQQYSDTVAKIILDKLVARKTLEPPKILSGI